MNNKGEIRLTEEMLDSMGFSKIKASFKDGTSAFFWELNLEGEILEEDKEPFCLVTNLSTDEDYPLVSFDNSNSYSFRYAEPVIVLLNILQSNCVIEGFKIN